MKLVPEDKVMILAPSHRGITLNETLTVLAVGGTVIYTDKFDAVQFFEQIRKTTPTWILGSPVVFNNIAAYAEKNDLDYGSDELKLIKSAGAPLTEELALRLQNIFNVPVYEGYGLTECGSIAFSMNAPQGYKAGSVGVPVGVDVAVMKETGEMAGYNQPGEILVRGPQVIKDMKTMRAGILFIRAGLEPGTEGIWTRMDIYCRRAVQGNHQPRRRKDIALRSRRSHKPSSGYITGGSVSHTDGGRK
jgi:acyl-CoA synthetase (AMP-forming)/AMP-acid ligase II